MRLALAAVASAIALASGCASDDRRFDLAYDFSKLDGAKVTYTVEGGFDVDVKIERLGHDGRSRAPVVWSEIYRQEVAAIESGGLGLVASTARLVNGRIPYARLEVDGDCISLDSGLPREFVKNFDDEIEKRLPVETSTRTILSRKGRVLSEESTTSDTESPFESKNTINALAPSFPARTVTRGEEWEVEIRGLLKETVGHVRWRLDHVETPPGTTRPEGVLRGELELEGPNVKASKGKIEARFDLETGLLSSETVLCDTTRAQGDVVTTWHHHIEIVAASYTPGAAAKR
ncbi:MAG TPA: hypothetical protein VFF73_37245 [Planctomycetota bacterium]|nr:hypothetical protein [Planctomycetota bacterium]